jgi:hypothetical protein
MPQLNKRSTKRCQHVTCWLQNARTLTDYAQKPLWWAELLGEPGGWGGWEGAKSSQCLHFRVHAYVIIPSLSL